MPRPNSVVEAFDLLDANLALDSRERVRAELRHRDVEVVLKRAGVSDGTFMQGSFARKTMRKPLKDIDIVVLLPESLRGEYFTPDGARRVHELFRGPLKARYGSNITFDDTNHAGKALQLCFTDVEFTIDLVAAFADDDPLSELVCIADRDEGSWEQSNTRTLLRVVAERNSETGRRFIHQVRMVKELTAQDRDLTDLCGLAVEALAYAAIDQKMPHAQAVHPTLERASALVRGQVLDPTGVDDLAAKWTSAQRLAYSEAFRRASATAANALERERIGDQTTAIELWGSLLGPAFPPVPARSTADTIAGLVGGGVTATGRVTSAGPGAVSARPYRAWRTR